MMRRHAALALTAFALAACSQGAAPDDRVDTDAPAATAPASAAIDPRPTAPSPAPGELAEVGHEAAVIHFDGFGPARFGADAEAVRNAWGRPLVASPDPADDPSACHYLVQEPRPGNGTGIAFMVEGGQFVRYDVDVPDLVAPGDLTTGMTAGDVEARFPGRVESEPHKYVDGGRYLVVVPEDGGDTRLLFEVDPVGTITGWRIGRLPQVRYVEGCS